MLAVSVAHPALASASASGEPTEAALAEARERFAEVRRLEDAGEWNEALALLQRVAAVKMTPQVRFHIALCMEHIGLFTQAMDQYGLALDDAQAAPAPEVTEEARAHLDRLNRLTPTITVAVAGARPSDEVLLDGRAIPTGSPPLSIRVDPGPHRVELVRDGEVIGRRYFAAKPTTAQRVELRPLIEGDADAATGSAMRAAGWASLGVGATSAVFSGVMFGLEASTSSHRAAYPTLGAVSAVVSGAALATGVVLLLAAPPPARPGLVALRPRLMPAPYLGADGGGLGLTGSF